MDGHDRLGRYSLYVEEQGEEDCEDDEGGDDEGVGPWHTASVSYLGTRYTARGREGIAVYG